MKMKIQNENEKSKWPTQKNSKCQELVLGSLASIDVKGIDVARPIWLRDYCPTLAQKQAKNAFFVFLGCFCPYHGTASRP